MNALHANRLVKLGWMLREASPTKLNTRMKFFRNIVDGEEQYCALGFACTIPEFNEHGLRFVDNVPTFEDKTNVWAGEAFFGLSFGEAVDLFCIPDGEGDDSPVDVSWRILGHVKQHAPEVDIYADAEC